MIQEAIKYSGKSKDIRDNLYHRISLICRGNLLVFSNQSNNNNLIDIIVKQNPSVKSEGVYGFNELESFISSSNFFKTVVLLSESNNITEQQLTRTLSVAWELIIDKGRLIICMPNQESIVRDLRLDHLKLRNLKKLVKNLGKVKVVREQPYKWLLMLVTKKDKDKDKRIVDESNRERIFVTSKLCSGNVLELGCGRGHLTKAINDLGLDITGVDINEGKIKLARELYPHIDFRQADLFNLNLPNNSYNTVVLAEVLEHFPENMTETVLSIAHNLLKKDGRLIVSVPNEDSILHPNHLRVFDRVALKKVLSPFGRPKLVTDQPYKWLIMYVDCK